MLFFNFNPHATHSADDPQSSGLVAGAVYNISVSPEFLNLIGIF